DRRIGIELAVRDPRHRAADPLTPDLRLETSDQSLAQERFDLDARGVSAAPLALAAPLRPLAVAPDSLDEIVDPLARCRDGPNDGRLPVVPSHAERQHLRQVLRGLVRPRTVSLVDDEDVGDLEDPGLDGLDVVAQSRDA